MEITFNLPHVFANIANNRTADANALRILLDALVRIDLVYLRAHPNAPKLYRSGVVYGRTVLWEPIPALYARGFGDCKSLACARIAELLIVGVEAQPTFRWVKRPDGAKDYHILVQTLSGVEDPSRVLGMGKNENAPIRAR